MLLKKIVLLVLVYLMFYKPEMFFIPHSINLSFGLLGFILYLFRAKYNPDLAIRTRNNVVWMIKAATPVVVVAIISCVINFSTDFEFVTYPLTLFFSINFCYLIAYLFQNIYGEINARTMIGYILSSYLVYMILAILMFVSPSIQDILLSLLKLADTTDLSFYITEGIRLVCFGASFYTAGLISGFILILLAFYISVYQHSQLKLVLLYLFFILIVAVGMMMARTTLIGAGIGIGVLVYYWLKSGRKIFKTLLYIFAALYLLFAVLSRLSSDVKDTIEQLSNFAFELFINYEETGSASTASSDRLMEMYETMPDNLITWIIGDARWEGEDGSYYMHIDVGYLRNIFYFGIIGLLTLLYFYASSLKRAIIHNRVLPQGNVLFFLSALAYVLILNLKGPADLFYYIVPFMFCDSYEHVG